MSQPEIRILADGDDLCRAAAEEFVRLADEAVRARGRFTVALSGGSTPEALYRLLAAEDGGFRVRVPWGQAHFFWGDERHVPPDHPDSNYRMASEAMLSRVPVPPGNVHRIPAENPDAAEAATEYAETLRTFFDAAAGRFPRFDLILLGMGSDGHTASLFPGTDAIQEKIRLVAALWVEKLGAYRITLTVPVLNDAASVIFLVSGEGKAEALRAVLEGPHRPDRFPAQLVFPREGRLLFLVDLAAARLLRQPC
ncbi:MAG: 6-phosphogluconolactonase [Candidatus Methylomirabilota bacterium]|jgi:6-phosphogluconolactonase